MLSLSFTRFFCCKGTSYSGKQVKWRRTWLQESRVHEKSSLTTPGKAKLKMRMWVMSWLKCDVVRTQNPSLKIACWGENYQKNKKGFVSANCHNHDGKWDNFFFCLGQTLIKEESMFVSCPVRERGNLNFCFLMQRHLRKNTRSHTPITNEDSLFQPSYFAHRVNGQPCSFQDFRNDFGMSSALADIVYLWGFLCTACRFLCGGRPETKQQICSRN